MADSYLLPDLIANSATRFPDNTALTYGKESLSYAALRATVRGFVNGVIGLGLQRGERVAIYLEKRFETSSPVSARRRAGGVYRSTRCSSPNRSPTSCATATCACSSPRRNATLC